MAELLTRGIPGRHSKFKMTEIGEVPEGWEIYPLEAVAVKVTDGEHLSPRLVENGFPILSAKHIREDRVVLEEHGTVSGEDFARFRKRCDPDSGDVLIVSRGATIGRVHYLHSAPTPFCLMGSVIQVRPLQDRVEGAFLAAFLSRESSQRELVKTSGSSAQQAIYLAHLKKMALPVPTIAEQREICRLLHVFSERFAAEMASLTRLMILKSALMSVLLTGEVRVRIQPDSVTPSNSAHSPSVETAP